MLHFAAFIAAGESVRRPEKYWDNNLVGSLRLLDAMRAAGVRRMVFSSTANVYGDPDELPIPETAATRPPNPYAASKLAVDHALRDEATAHGLAAVSLRYFNVAGAHRAPDGSMIGERHDPETHLIPIALQVAAGHAGEAAALRRRLPDAGRHLRPGLHPHHRPGRRPPAGSVHDGGPGTSRLQPRQRHRVLQPPGRSRWSAR